jgi:hypothetical protein
MEWKWYISDDYIDYQLNYQFLMLLNVWFENGWHTNCSNKWFNTSFDLCQQKRMQISYSLFGEEPNTKLVSITIHLKSMPSLITIFLAYKQMRLIMLYQVAEKRA